MSSPTPSPVPTLSGHQALLARTLGRARRLGALPPSARAFLAAVMEHAPALRFADLASPRGRAARCAVGHAATALVARHAPRAGGLGARGSAGMARVTGSV